MFRRHPWTLLLLGAVSMGSLARAQDDMLPPGDLPEPEFREPGTPLAKEGVWVPSRAWYGATNPPVGQATGGSYTGGTHIGSPYNWNGPGSAPVGANGGTFGWNGNGWNGYGFGDPYVYHFGPGFHRHSNYGHYRFPYYNYRAPWYFSGSPSYHRDTNHPW